MREECEGCIYYDLVDSGFGANERHDWFCGKWQEWNPGGCDEKQTEIEMSTEEKAKAYDEAMEKAKRYCLGEPGNETAEILQNTIRQIFPELRESEDERIRLISLVKNCYENGGYALSLDEYKSLTAWLEKQKEQKPAEWSATDKAFIKDCAHVLDKNGYEACAERLLSMFPVNPTEWSEEDEKKMEDLVGLLAIFEGCSTVNVGTAAKYNYWLKSFRSRPKSSDNWKPSEEQMKALLWCTAHLGGADHRVLAELYEHLKML